MRWSALLVLGLAATLAAAAPSSGLQPAGDQLTPAMPWPPPGVAAAPLAAARPSWSPPLDLGRRSRRSTTRVVPMPPAPKAPTEPAPPEAAGAPTEPEPTEAAPVTPGKPALDNATPATRWYEESRPSAPPQHLYLEQLLYGEKAEGWQWGSGEMSLAQAYEQPVDPESTEPLSFGIDSRMERTVLKNAAGEYEDAPMVGPRVRWRPTGHTQLDVSPMVGIATPYPMQEVVVVFGWKY